jgi:hypothetical protein
MPHSVERLECVQLLDRESRAGFPPGSADPHVISFCLSLVLLVGVDGSVQRRLSTDIENCTAASDDSKVVHLQRVPHADSIAPGSMPQRGLRWL